MENTSATKDKNKMGHPLNHINIGFVAYGDTGKTTMSDGMIYYSGRIRTMGRVD